MNGSNIGARLCETVKTASSHPDEPSESGVWSGEVEPLNVLPHLDSTFLGFMLYIDLPTHIPLVGQLF